MEEAKINAWENLQKVKGWKETFTSDFERGRSYWIGSYLNFSFKKNSP